ncbi:AAA family ATPase [Nocardia cyriacigeorgica]|uniref:AAA family ATPase n=2 Tax=Nocardia cyriacigeorgica TaxID=135487 RepID=UPI0011093804|nr:AAA family ATPase [Nocardia cyriacigeorgica]TLF59492.1 hypothetical protein FEK31_06950 [Nocardia cyriacigeorgica]
MPDYRQHPSFVDTASDILSRVDHSAVSNTRYREFEQYIASLANLNRSEVYTTFASKPGNIGVRLEQSKRARQAHVLVVLTKSKDYNQLRTDIDAITRYQRDHRPDAEVVLFSHIGGRWLPRALTYTAGDTTALRIKPFLDELLEVEVIPTASEPKLTQEEVSELTFMVDPDGKQLATAAYPVAILRRSSWDDYGYKTMFTLELLPEAGDSVAIGRVKILHREQESGQTPIPYEFQKLTPNYASLGQSYTYYEKLNTLSEALSKRVMISLRDMVYRDSIRESFEDHEGFELSLTRTGTAERALEDAPALFTKKNYAPTGLQGAGFEFTTNTGGKDFTIAFSFGQSDKLPDRINGLIGYNGTGKTQLLAKLALAATSDRLTSPKDANEHGVISYHESGRFSSVIAVSYSAFDTFEVPSFENASPTVDTEHSHSADLAESLKDRSDYVYCGLRMSPGDVQSGNVGHALKSVDIVMFEFRDALSIARERGKRPILRMALRALQTDPSFARIGVPLESSIDNYEWWVKKRIIESLSTEHKIVLNILVQIVARSVPGSLILIDEPESHLHPSLLAAFMKALNTILRRQESFAIIATHSPVVLQEIPRRYVKILKRVGDKTRISVPELETFGENVGILTSSVFDLDSAQVDFHSVLKNLASSMSLTEIDALFDNEMSAQARAYVRALHRQARERAN